MSEREELEAVIARAVQSTHGTPADIATAIINSGYTQGNAELVEAAIAVICEWDDLNSPDVDCTGVGGRAPEPDSPAMARLRKALSGRSDGDAAGRALIPVEVLKKAIEIQTEGREMHPLTCPNRGDARHAEVFDNGVIIDVGTLLPTSAYLICVACGYQQDYSHPAAQFLLEAARSAAQDTQRAERATNGELHGDGVRDDTEAVQERVNAGLTIGDSHE